MSNIEEVNATNEEMAKLLAECRTIAIVGLSNKPHRDSYRVAVYLQEHGYRIIPVNPKEKEILGEKCYSTLSEIPDSIDIVNVFRRSEAVPSLAEETLKLTIRPQAFWLQLGVVHNQAAASVKDAGLAVVQDKCIKIVHQQYNI